MFNLSLTNNSSFNHSLPAFPQHPTPMPPGRYDGEIILSGMYVTFYVIGETGNALVVIIISSIFLARRRTGRWSHVYLYILALATADILALSCVPFVVTDLLRREWIFGRSLCKFHYMTECLNKALSPLLLTLLSFDRFIGVCFPTDTRFRRMRFSLISILVVGVVTLLLMTPIAWYAETVYVKMLRKYACTSYSMPLDVQMSWIYALFGVGYCTPFLFLTTFYTCLVKRLRVHSKRVHSSGSHRSVRKVTTMSFVLVFFYATCYTPYWVMLIGLPILGVELNGTAAVYTGYLVHLLPYANSAFNPILYAWLNNELRRSHAESVSARDESMLFLSTATGRFAMKPLIKRHRLPATSKRAGQKKRPASAAADPGLIQTSSQVDESGPTGLEASTAV